MALHTLYIKNRCKYRSLKNKEYQILLKTLITYLNYDVNYSSLRHQKLSVFPSPANCRIRHGATKLGPEVRQVVALSGSLSHS